MMSGNRVLVIDFAPCNELGAKLAEMLGGGLRKDTHIRHVALPLAPSPATAADLSSLLRDHAPHLTLWVLPADPGPEYGKLFRLLDLRLGHHLVVTGGADPARLHGYLQLGARDFILTPLKEAEVLPRVFRALQAATSTPQGDTPPLAAGAPGLVGQSPGFLREMSKIPLMSRSAASVLIMGETGTGKELCARSIHRLGPRADRPFVAVNCGAIPLELIENELFGHQKEAFTGAGSHVRGLIQEADGGTIFLDEIDGLPPVAQVKLLRFLQEKEIRPLGSARTVKVDVRVVAATNVDVDSLIEEGKLRRDLYYRINVLSIRLPALRDRPEDIPLLLEHFLDRHRASTAREWGREALGFTPGALQALMLHTWPGNVRELEHVVERAVLLCPGDLISERELVLPRQHETEPAASFHEAKARVIADFERRYLTSLLTAYRGNVSRAALSARKNRRAFFQLMQKHHIDASQYRVAP